MYKKHDRHTAPTTAHRSHTDSRNRSRSGQQTAEADGHQQRRIATDQDRIASPASLMIAQTPIPPNTKTAEEEIAETNGTYNKDEEYNLKSIQQKIIQKSVDMYP